MNDSFFFSNKFFFNSVLNKFLSFDNLFDWFSFSIMTANGVVAKLNVSTDLSGSDDFNSFQKFYTEIFWYNFFSRCRPRLNSPLNGFQVSKCRNWGNYTLHIELYSSINSHSFQISLISQSNAIDTLLRRAQLAPQLNTNQMCCELI